MVESYAELLGTRSYEPHTVRRKLQHVRHFIAWFSPEDPAQAHPTDIERYILHLHRRDISRKTMRNRLSSVKGFFDYLYFHGHIQNHPLQLHQRLILPETIPVYLPDDDVELLLDMAREEGIWVEVVLALNTGLRMNELRHLKWTDIDLANKQLVVQGQHAKSKRPRTVPLNSKALEVLKAQRRKYRQFRYVFPGGQGGKHNRNVWDKNTMRSYKWWLRLSLDRIRDKIPTIANLPKGSTCRGWHIMRHTFATRLAKAGVDVVKIKDWLGHRSVNTTLRYVHLARHYDPDIELI